MTLASVIIGGIILAVLIVRAVWIMRAEAGEDGGGRPRGVRPGTGYTEIESNYFSGVGGGSQMITRVPRDPQEYARAFVPKRGGKHRS
ncbi:hypothetical protein MWU52_06035 [Jannaschia sp. S6380]|uniref:hypothetical protein n=1 Tax=Jannaschia sp. S6380 TaxID=2926408 RepID=UPI001FF5F6D4|nr:hypothetical protein [Jannaschia sp. S6380]MCK0167104.1 hypothetical protein [Jannaschia sp. S6380]